MPDSIENMSEKPARMLAVPEGVLRIDYRSAVDRLPDWALARHEPESAVWVVCLHGHGSAGDQLYIRPDIRDSWLVEFKRLGLSTLTPNLRGDSWMGPAAEKDLHGLLDYVRGRFGGKRFLFFSGSMGGTANLIYAAMHPQDAQAVVALGAATDIGSYYQWCDRGDRPIHREIADAIRSSYGGTPEQLPGLYERHSALHNSSKLTMPVYLAHGGEDLTIPVSQARRLAEGMTGRKNFEFREISGGAHDSPLSHTSPLARMLKLISDRP